MHPNLSRNSCAELTAGAYSQGADVCRGMAYLHGFRPPVLHRFPLPKRPVPLTLMMKHAGGTFMLFFQAVFLCCFCRDLKSSNLLVEELGGGGGGRRPRRLKICDFGLSGVKVRKTGSCGGKTGQARWVPLLGPFKTGCL